MSLLSLKARLVVAGLGVSFAAVLATAPLLAQTPPATPAASAKPAIKGGTLERIKVHGKSLEGNLEGDSADRDVIIYLPPSYGTDKNRRYPVVYELHGYSLTAETWTRMIGWPGTLDRALAASGREVIVVAPDAMTLHNGSMYSNSVTTGDWESFISKDLVAYIDKNYRTLANRDSRGLTGHSMGGYGTVRIAMKRPEVFSSFYAMSSCCLPPRTAPANGLQIEAVKSAEEARAGGMGVRSVLSVSAAWAANPAKPPFYVDLPTKDGKVDQSVIDRWTANSPLVMAHQYVPNIKQYKAIAIDIGTQDGGLPDSTALHDILQSYGVVHSFEVYEGTHTSKVAERFEKHVLPFFFQNLSFTTPKR